MIDYPTTLLNLRSCKAILGKIVFFTDYKNKEMPKRTTLFFEMALHSGVGKRCAPSTCVQTLCELDQLTIPIDLYLQMPL